ncbi:GNAT family N-acetyltransferase [Paenibacillus yanchengensis]|uniref:GNAT family N-acetyltransferase n=1 Tax=Paenibacillus yanchengensis TaxID=2035833 RepID=A0ABW4YMB6_9BACL
MKVFHIRAATGQDEPFLREVLSESLIEHAEPLIDTTEREKMVIKYVADWGKQGDIGFVAENQAGEPIGAVIVRYFEQQDQSYGYVSDRIPELTMAIQTVYRGHGIGTALLTTLFDELKRLAIDQISLNVNMLNEAAMKLYYRFGFVETKVTETTVTMVANIF